MSYPEIPPMDLLNQLAPDVKEYLLNKVNRYYKEQREEEDKQALNNILSSGRGFTYKGPDGKLRHII